MKEILIIIIVVLLAGIFYQDYSSEIEKKELINSYQFKLDSIKNRIEIKNTEIKLLKIKLESIDRDIAVFRRKR